MTTHATHHHHQLDYIEMRADSPERLANARHFYASTFGWEYKEWAPVYVDTQSSGVTSGIAVAEERSAQPLPVIYSDELEKTLEAVLAGGATLTKTIFAFPGGRRFQFVDPAGNEVGVWSEK